MKKNQYSFATAIAIKTTQQLMSSTQSQGFSVAKSGDDEYFKLFPPGYRFCPKDSELILDYLKEKVMNRPLPRNRIKEVNLKDYSLEDLIDVKKKKPRSKNLESPCPDIQNMEEQKQLKKNSSSGLQVNKTTQQGLDKSADDKYFDLIPPGYRFCPKDSELILDYLKEKVMNRPLPRNRIKEVNLKDYSPYDLIEKYCKAYGEKEWYFFTPRDRKYPKGDRRDRAAGDGFWKATETKKPVRSNGGTLVGYKRSLVYYKGKPPNGKKTNWLMNEYSVSDNVILTYSDSELLYGFDELPQHNFVEPDQVSAYCPFDQSFGHSMAQNRISCFHTSMTNLNSSNQASLPFVGEQLPVSSMPSSAQYLDNQQGTTQLFSLPFISTQLPTSSMPSSVQILDNQQGNTQLFSLPLISMHLPASSMPYSVQLVENQQSTSQLSSIQSIVDYLQNPKSLEDNLSFSSEDYSITSVGAADLDVGCIDIDCSSSEEFLMDWESVIPSSTLTQQQPSPPLTQ
ncbi:hypothetical protein HHK36_019789 [Tetracentron sinense]|uniref:NAC domain-containing protein n=1 Tax=Tetracentron sinense TaxID=13715 RepID=A0A834YY65_TETSI|nr:hypothetical protein HHK36_019789 [Tetracentron sinense]